MLINLGTPDAPEPAAVRRYLAEFLSDPRVVEIPPVVWKPILYGAILTTRPAQSAKKYAAIWTKDGSPLAIPTERQAQLLAGYLGEHGHHVKVAWAMRYGAPAIADVLAALGKTAPLLARMSGSGATCFALYERHDAMRKALEYIDEQHPEWWLMGGQLR